MFDGSSALKSPAPIRLQVRWAVVLLVWLLATVSARPMWANDQGDGVFGVLVMAHGGSDEWDQAVLDAVEALSNKYPTEVAFGMADASTIEDSVRQLEAASVDRIGVVRLFISGESWYERTEQILGLREGAPSAEEARAEAEAKDAAASEGRGGPAPHENHGEPRGHSNQDGPAPQGGHGAPAGHGGRGGHHPAPFYRIGTTASFALSAEGLAQAEEMDQVLLSRVRALSSVPESEDVLILAHGPGDDAENERWIATIGERTELLRSEMPFRRVEVMTLREDWPEKRKEAEQRIREFVQRARDEDGQAIVIPYRVFGFGPYSDILDGLEYVSDGQGLLPHEAVPSWIDRQASLLQAGRFQKPID